MDVKDIDFDELDRAVNSAISKNKPVDDGLSAMSPVTSANVPDVNPLPSPTPVFTPTPAASSAPTAPIPVARQTMSRPATGRFMDMVHSSANMRVAVPERPSLRPLSSPISSVSQKPNLNMMPKMPSGIVNNSNPDLDIDQISDEIDKTLNINSNENQDSPFLPDAKVEKRPLNAFTSEQTVIAPVKLPDAISFPPIGKTDDRQENVDTLLPAELQNDLLSIEADEVTKTDEVYIPEDSGNNEDELMASAPQENQTDDGAMKNQYVPYEQNSAPVLEEKPVEPATAAPSSVLTSASSSTTTNPIVTTSISQQYAELPSTGDKEIGAIYDTNSYHKAMTPPTKKKSGWMWVIFIALLMIVSVGAGIAVYFFILPQV